MPIDKVITEKYRLHSEISIKTKSKAHQSRRTSFSNDAFCSFPFIGVALQKNKLIYFERQFMHTVYKFTNPTEWGEISCLWVLICVCPCWYLDKRLTFMFSLKQTYAQAIIYFCEILSFLVAAFLWFLNYIIWRRKEHWIS